MSTAKGPKKPTTGRPKMGVGRAKKAVRAGGRTSGDSELYLSNKAEVDLTVKRCVAHLIHLSDDSLVDEVIRRLKHATGMHKAKKAKIPLRPF